MSTQPAERERQLQRWLMALEPDLYEGMDARARRIYRRQVRRSLFNGVRGMLPITWQLLGEDAAEALLARWIDTAPPQTRFYWQLPIEFAAWLATLEDLPHPACAELAHWEAIELDVLNAPDPPRRQEVTADLDLNRTLALDPSARLCIYQHPVHRLTSSPPATAWPDALPVPVFIVAFRHDERLHWNVVEPALAQLLAQTAEGATLGDALTFLASLYGEGGIDQAALLDGVRALIRRGALLGASP